VGKTGGGEEESKNACFELNSILKHGTGEILVKITAVFNSKVDNFIFSGKMQQAGNIQHF
jgi:hypothetical protein